MSAPKMAGQLHGRHRLAVLPGLAESRTPSLPAGNEYGSAVATLDDQTSNRNLVPLSAFNSKQLMPPIWNGANSVRSRDSEGNIGAHLQGLVTRVTMLEEGNKALLEEVYRLQSNARAAEFSKKEALNQEKKNQHDLMDTLRSSNDVISQLTSRLRKAEEKLHRERENVQALNSHSKKLEQALLTTQRENDSQRDLQMTMSNELRHKIDDLSRKWDKSDRTSDSIIDEFHQMKSKVEMQAMEFSHLQSEMKQRSKRMEDELKQSSQQARFQKDTTSMAEQNNLQLRHLLESRLAETRDALIEIRNRISQTEVDGRSQVQQLAVKVSEQQTAINDLGHKRQEERQSLEKLRQEHDHSEETERLKLQNKIQAAVEEMSDKLLQKEVRLREEAVKKFIDVEKLMQREESARINFEKQIREETENRWNMQQKIYLEEMQAMKEMRRTERSKQSANNKKIEEALNHLDRKFIQDRKALEKVLLAEITKRENQASRVLQQIEGVQEQLRVALSSLQQAIGGLQYQSTKDNEKLLSNVKERFAEEEKKVSRALSDTDSRLVAVTTRLTHQEETFEAKMIEFRSTVRDEHNQLVRSTADWQETAHKDITILQDALKELPQELRETQERLNLVKSDVETRSTLESESRLKAADALKKQTRQTNHRIEELDLAAIADRTRFEKLNRDLIEAQGTVAQVERFLNDARANLSIRINSETKMRLEETSHIKRDVARMRVDLQPLLWQQHNVTRTFVKKPSSSMNEWGIYQCARWYDIKMRWLRLLDRSRDRKLREEEEHQSGSSPVAADSPVISAENTDRTPTPRSPHHSTVGENYQDMTESETDSRTADEDDRLQEAHRPRTLSNDDDDALSVEDVVGNLSEGDTPSTKHDAEPRPAWYNEEKAGLDAEERDDGDGTFADDDDDGTATNPMTGEVAEQANAKRDANRTPQASLHESPAPASAHQSERGDESGRSANSLRRSSRVTPRGSNSNGEQSGSQRRNAEPKSSSGGGTAYDMEGRKN